ncbi:terpene synthase family protein [Streptomyces netropsis]|nr:bifunctional terpene synthase/polyprenyl synthetase family protein [Streptomyces netropsis]
MGPSETSSTPDASPDADGMTVVISLPRQLFSIASVHPRSSWLRTMHDQWLDEQFTASGISGGINVVRKCDAVSLFLHGMPHAPADRVLEAALMASMAFAIDDLFETGPQVELNSYLAVAHADGAAIDRNADLVIFARAMERARQAIGPRLYARTLKSLEKWANSTATANAAVSSWDGIDDYLKRRWVDAGFGGVRVVVEYCAGVDLTDLEESSLLDDLHTACFEHSVLVNDLFSYRKEKQAGYGMNAVSVLTDTEGMTLQSAVDTVCSRIAAAEEAFAEQVRLFTHNDPNAHADIARYVHGWRDALAGNIAWALTSPRFNGHRLPLNSSLPTHMVLHPSHTTYRYP